MSYEGYVQCICAHGHYYEYDAFDEERLCPVCRAPRAWHNAVSETNCDSYGEIPMTELEARFQITPTHVETCSLGFAHAVAPAVFRVPTEAETQPLRCWRPGYGDSELVPLPQKE